MFLTIAIFIGNILIPNEYYNRDSTFFSKIIPGSEISCWEYRRYYLDGKSELKFLNAYSSCEGGIDYTIEELPFNSYLSNSYFTSSYIDIIVYKTKKNRYTIVKNKEELQYFLGSIDNIEDALFLLSYEGYWFEPGNYECGSYYRQKDGFFISLKKMNFFTDCIDQDQLCNKNLDCYQIEVKNSGEILFLPPASHRAAP